MATRFEKRLIQAAKEGIAIARGELDPATYRVHHMRGDNSVPTAGLVEHLRAAKARPDHHRMKTGAVKHRKKRG